MGRRKGRRSDLMFENADRYDAQASKSGNSDDPRWLGRLARWLRAKARSKERGFEHKQHQMRRSARKASD